MLIHDLVKSNNAKRLKCIDLVLQALLRDIDEFHKINCLRFSKVTRKKKVFALEIISSETLFGIKKVFLLNLINAEQVQFQSRPFASTCCFTLLKVLLISSLISPWKHKWNFPSIIINFLYFSSATKYQNCPFDIRYFFLLNFLFHLFFFLDYKIAL